jgi:hypothetical protein
MTAFGGNRRGNLECGSAQPSLFSCMGFQVTKITMQILKRQIKKHDFYTRRRLVRVLKICMMSFIDMRISGGTEGMPPEQRARKLGAIMLMTRK